MNQIRDNSGKLLADITDFLSESDDFNNTITVNDDNEKKSMAEICSYDFSSDTSLYKGFVGEPAISKELKSSPPGIPKPAIPISPSPLPRISSSQFVVNPLHFVIPDESSSPSIKLNKRPIIGLTRKTIKCFSSSEENNIHKASNSSSWILNSTEWPLSSPSHETDTVISRMTAKVQDNNNKKTPLVMTSPKKNVIDNRIVLQKSPRRSISSFMSPVILPKKEQQNEEQKKVTEGLVKSTKDVSKKRVEPIEQESVANQQQQKRTRLNTIFFTPEQRKILKLVVEQGQNVFFTGAAGTGKSVLLRQIIADMKKKYEYKSFTSFANSTTSLSGTCRVAVTASTGLAACNIGGMTLHSFAGIGLGKEEADVLVKRVRKNKKINKRWKDVKVLIIDEISMIDGTLFDKLDVIARKIRKKPNVPFGGIQIVITGDFYQLPPVPDKGKPVNFTFEAECWSEAITHTIELRQVFRQKDDRFSTMLNEMRNGKMSPGTIHTFQNLSRQPKVPAGITPTHLYPRRFEVEQANKRKLEQLRGGNIVYEAVDTYSSPEIEQIVNLDNMIAVKELSLKRGAQVMMIKNMDETLVNGSLGQVLGLMSESAYMLMQHEITVMSSQEARNVIEDRADALDEKISKIGQTMSVSDDEDCGSSPSSTEGEYDDSVFGIPKSIAELDNDKLNVKWKRKRARLQILQNNSENLGKKYPLVRFYLGDGTTRDVLVQPETWTVEDAEGKVMASRSQVPLILAWALSIHKSQGQTLEWVTVDLGKAFEKGQAYVALSRAVRIDGLQVMRFRADKVMVHDKVIEFYKSLASVDQIDKPNVQVQEPVVEMKPKLIIPQPPLQLPMEKENFLPDRSQQDFAEFAVDIDDSWDDSFDFNRQTIAPNAHYYMNLKQ